MNPSPVSPDFTEAADLRIDAELALKRLTITHRKIFTLYSAGYTEEEIAARYNTNKMSVSRKIKDVIIATSKQF